jgi:hypothetical protein
MWSLAMRQWEKHVQHSGGKIEEGLDFSVQDTVKASGNSVRHDICTLQLVLLTTPRREGQFTTQNGAASRGVAARNYWRYDRQQGSI